MTWVIATSLRRAVLLLPVFGLFLLGASCGDFFVSDSSIQSVTVSPSSVILKAAATPADTFTFSSSARSVGGTSKDDTATATWKSSNTAVVTAASGGVVTAAGSTGNLTATITATDGGQSGSASVLTYTGTAPTSFTLNFTLPSGVAPTAIPVGTSFPVSAIASLSGNASANISNFVTWSITSNTAGATIDTKGNVTVPGSATAGNFTVQAVAQFGAAANPASITETLPFTVI